MSLLGSRLQKSQIKSPVCARQLQHCLQGNKIKLFSGYLNCYGVSDLHIH